MGILREFIHELTGESKEAKAERQKEEREAKNERDINNVSTNSVDEEN